MESESSVTIAANALESSLRYLKHVQSPVENVDIIWGKSFLVEDVVSNSDALNYFRFRKVHLQIRVDKLWSRFEIYPIKKTSNTINQIECIGW